MPHEKLSIIRHIFGLNGQVKDNIFFSDDQTVVYPAGANTILYNYDTKQQKIFNFAERGEPVTAMALSSNKRYLALAQKAQQPTVVIYDMQTFRKRKVLYPVDAESREFISVAFSADGKFIATQTGGPDWKLYLWSWEKAKLMGSTRVAQTSMNNQSLDRISDESEDTSRTASTTNGRPSAPTGAGAKESGSRVNSVRFSTADPYLLSVVGSNVLRIYRYADGALKSCSGVKFENRNYLSQAWLAGDRLVVGTECGRLYYYHSSGELFAEGRSQVGKSARAVCSIEPLSKGFLTGTDNGVVLMFEKNDDYVSVSSASGVSAGAGFSGPYKKTFEIVLPDDLAKVVSIAQSPNEGVAVVTTDLNQLFSVSLNSSDLTNVVQSGEESGGQTAESSSSASMLAAAANSANGCLTVYAKSDQFSQPFHSGQITGMDVCVRKPLVATCGNDRSVRIWNYLDQSIDLCKQFNEETLSVAFHPSGLYLLIGFVDKLKLMNVLMDDIRPFREFGIRGCQECRFSNGGQYFAAVHGTTIQIYNTWTFENLANLKGHSGRVKSLCWASDDLSLVSACLEGAIYHWSLKDMFCAQSGGVRRQGENILKSCSYTSAVLTPQNKAILAVGSDKSIKEIVDYQIVRSIEVDTVYTQLVLGKSSQILLAGTSSGTIRALKWPFVASNDGSSVVATLEYQEHQAHLSSVTKLRLSFDDQYLFSVSSDGCLCVFKVFDKDGKLGGLSKERSEFAFADEILVTQADLDEKAQALQDLKNRMEEVKMEHEYQLRLKNLNFTEKLKETTEKFVQEIDSLKMTASILRSEKEKERLRFQEEVAQENEHHKKERLELETTQNQRLMSEYEKFQDLQAKGSRQQTQWDAQFSELQRQHEQAVQEVTLSFEKQLEERQLEVEQLEKTLSQQTQEYEEIVRETEEDADAEIGRLKYRYELKLREEKETGLRLKGENAIMRKKFNTLQSEIDSKKADIVRVSAEEKKFQGMIKSLERDIQGLKREIQERDDTVQDKERRIYDLKKKNQELEKFKFVLDYKIKELKNQIEPREKDIQSMTGQIKEMDVELQQYNQMNNTIELAISDLKLKVKAAEKEVRKERARYQACEAIVKRFKLDLSQCMSNIQSPAALKQSIKVIYQRFCQAKGISISSSSGGQSLGKSSNDDVNVANTDKVDIDQDSGSSVNLQNELARQRQHLERTVIGLKAKIAKDQKIHRLDSAQIVNENTVLIKELNTLRRELKAQRGTKTVVPPAACEKQIATNSVQESVAAEQPTTKLPPLL